MRKAAILFMICLSVAGCLNRTGNRQRTVDCEDASLPENLPTDEELGGYPVTDRQAEFKEYYVTDRQGIDAKQEPDANSKTLLHYNFGDALKVFVDPGRMYEALNNNPALYYHVSSGVSPSFYAVGGNVYREWRDERESTVQCWRYELVFVERSAVGDMSDVRLIPEELNEQWVDDERTSDGLLTVALIDKCVYDSMEMHKVDYLLADTIPKLDGRIALKTEAGEVVFEDDTDAVDGYRYYYHEGTYETPNQHVVSVQYYDCFAYQMADKISGDILDFSGFPHVSPDLKYILSLYPLDTDGLRCAGVDLYRITDEGKIVLIMESKYMNWGATDDRRDAFWGSDGCFYCKARHPKVNWGNNPNCQYLRIKLSGV